MKSETLLALFQGAHRRPPHGGRGLKFRPSSRQSGCPVSPSPRRAWIEMLSSMLLITSFMSPSPRRAWIEIRGAGTRPLGLLCRPPHGGRGLKCSEEAVCLAHERRPPHGGRGLKCQSPRKAIALSRSPSPRRAWIEICRFGRSRMCLSSRPPHGGRGLKYNCFGGAFAGGSSPSPRRAWIEILPRIPPQRPCTVALPTEGVD